MKNFWQQVVGKPYLLYEGKPSASASNDDNLAISTVRTDTSTSENIVEAQIAPTLQVKENYNDCTTTEEKIAWSRSERGQSIIQNRPLLKHYYENGYLFKLFQNPMWEVRLKEWLAPLPPTDPNQKTPAVPYGLTLPPTDEEIETNRRQSLHQPHQNPPLSLIYEEYYNEYYYYTVPYEKKMELFTKGYTIIQGIIPKQLIAAAIEAINGHIMDTDLYFDVLHNEKYYPKNYMDKKDKKSLSSSLSSFWSSKKKQQEEAEAEKQKQGVEEKKKGKEEGTYAENPFLNPEKLKVRLESKKNQKDEDPHFVSGGTNDLAVLSLFYATPLHAMVESLLHGSPSQYSQKIAESRSNGTSHPLKPAPTSKDGKGNIEEIRRPFRVSTGGGQVAYRFSQPVKRSGSHHETLAKIKQSNMIKAGDFGEEESKDKKKKKSPSSLYDGITSDDPLLNREYPPIGGNSWHVDGLGRGQWGTFSFLIGIPLNDQFDEFSGNLCLHDGSHYLLQSYLKEYAKRFNSTDNWDERYSLVNKIEKPNLGEPTQILASAGDAIIALHKVAHLGGPNYSNEVRKMVYFRVSHERHHELRFAALDNIWIEYEGMQDVIH